jgi:RNA polymerase subunit RPABC4/transcription elongation factor Spt4
MLDLKKCPGCGSNTSLSTPICPYCGFQFDAGTKEVTPQSVATVQRRCPNCATQVPANRSVCPTCKSVLKEKSQSGSYLLIGGFIVAVLVLAVFIFHIPGVPAIPSNSSHAMAVTAAPTIPTCNIEISGKKLPTGTIQLTLMALTCGPKDVSELQVIVNGKPEGTLNYQLGSRGTFPGHNGPDQVIVVAKFSSGYTKTVFVSTYA